MADSANDKSQDATPHRRQQAREEGQVAQSPDLNPIENLWNHLDCQARKRKPLPQTKQDLITAIQEEWNNNSLEMLQNLIMSLPHRIEAVIKAKGGNTKY